MKSEKKVDMNGLSREEKLKYEIAEELGLLDRVLENGWENSLSQGNGPDRRSGNQAQTLS